MSDAIRDSIGQAEIEDITVCTHPTGYFRWHSGDYGVSGDIFGNNCSRSHECAFVESDTANDGGIGTYASSTLDKSPNVVVACRSRVLAPGGANIREDHTRATEYVVFNNDTLVHADVVLNLHAVTDANLVGNKHILSQTAVLTDDGIGHDVAVVPDLSAAAYLSSFIDVSALVSEIMIIHSRHPVLFQEFPLLLDRSGRHYVECCGSKHIQGSADTHEAAADCR